MEGRMILMNAGEGESSYRPSRAGNMNNISTHLSDSWQKKPRFLKVEAVYNLKMQFETTYLAKNKTISNF